MALRTLIVILAMALSGCQSHHLPTPESIATVQRQHDAFTDVCSDRAHEWVLRTPLSVNTIYLSRPSDVKGGWDFELFFGVTRPGIWAFATLLDGPAPPDRMYEAGTYEARYTHIPVVREIDGVRLQFHGVRQEIVDLSTKQVIAERENYIWGAGDLNRATFCIGTNWFSGNDQFLDRVLGYRYRHEAPRTFTPERFVKAKAVRSIPVSIELRSYSQEQLLPRGSVRDYNTRTITLPGGGHFWMPGFWNQEPMDAVATLEMQSSYVFVLLPGGSLRNWPLRQILLFRRDLAGRPLEASYIQLPRFVDWSNGWGMRSEDIAIDGRTVTFSVYGKKTPGGPYSDQGNSGRYSMRYDFVADLHE